MIDMVDTKSTPSYSSRLYVLILFLTPPKSQTSDLERFRQIWQKLSFYVRQVHYNTDNAYARGLRGGAFSIHHKA